MRVGFSVPGVAADIELPDIPDVGRPPAAYWRGRLEESSVAAFVAGSAELRGRATAAVADAVASLATAIPPPYGPAVVAGVTALRFAGSLLGFFDAAARPRAPNITGVDLDALSTFPLGDETRAVLAGKIASGLISSTQVETVQVVRDAAADTLDIALHAITRGRWGGALDRELASYSATQRSVALFTAYAPFDLVVARAMGSAARRDALAKLLAWAGPRVQLRETLLAWCLYRQGQAVLAMMTAVGASVSEETSRALRSRFPSASDPLFYRGLVRPVLGVEWLPRYGNQGDSDWPRTRALAGSSGVSVVAWLERILDGVAPVPKKLGDGTWVYAPLPRSVIEDELENHYWGGGLGFQPAAISDVVISNSARYEMTVPRYIRSLDSRPASGVFAEQPESWAQALRKCFQLAAVRRAGTFTGGDEAHGFPGGWVGAVARHRRTLEVNAELARADQYRGFTDLARMGARVSLRPRRPPPPPPSPSGQPDARKRRVAVAVVATGVGTAALAALGAALNRAARRS